MSANKADFFNIVWDILSCVPPSKLKDYACEFALHHLSVCLDGLHIDNVMAPSNTTA